MSPQINSQGPLSDLPRLHVADESNMVAGIVSKVWEHFGFYQAKEGPKTKENLYNYDEGILKGLQKAIRQLWHICFIFVSVSLELLH